jgi:hypothetical protein
MTGDINTITGVEFNELAGEMELDLLAAFKSHEVEIDELLTLAEKEGWSTERLMREIDRRTE